MSYSGYTIEDIEDAVIETLKIDTALSRYVRIFDHLTWNKLDELGKLVKQYPALLVAYSGGNDDNRNISVTDHAGLFIVLCCTQNLRSSSAAARSEDGREGVYDLIQDVFSCLHFSDLGLSIISCVSRDVRPLAASAGLAIFSREFEVKWRLTKS